MRWNFEADDGCEKLNCSELERALVFQMHSFDGEPLKQYEFGAQTQLQETDESEQREVFVKEISLKEANFSTIQRIMTRTCGFAWGRREAIYSGAQWLDLLSLHTHPQLIPYQYEELMACLQEDTAVLLLLCHGQPNSCAYQAFEVLSTDEKGIMVRDDLQENGSRIGMSQIVLAADSDGAWLLEVFK